MAKTKNTLKLYFIQLHTFQIKFYVELTCSVYIYPIDNKERFILIEKNLNKEETQERAQFLIDKLYNLGKSLKTMEDPFSQVTHQLYNL